jgi:SAM-dependent methyltransferase
MSDSDAARIAGYYDELVDRYGHDPRAVDASSADALEARYRSLAEVTPLAGKTVLEVGCGFGDLGAYVTGREDNVTYRGIDVSRRMIDVGREVHPRLDLREANVLDLDDRERYDVVLAQGVFYLLGERAEAKMHDLLVKMFQLAREAVGVSAISTWSDRAAETGEYRVDPVALLAYARSLTTSVALRHDYHPGDVTLYLYKRPT